MLCFYISYLLYLFFIYFLFETVIVDNVLIFVLLNLFLITKWGYNFHCFYKYFICLLDSHYEKANEIMTNTFTTNTIFSFLDVTILFTLPNYFYVMSGDFIFELYNLVLIVFLKYNCRLEQMQEESVNISSENFPTYT